MKFAEQALFEASKEAMICPVYRWRGWCAEAMPDENLVADSASNGTTNGKVWFNAFSGRSHGATDFQFRSEPLGGPVFFCVPLSQLFMDALVISLTQRREGAK